MMLAHNVHDVQSFQRHVHSNRLNGVDNHWLTPEEAKDYCPPLDISPDRPLSGDGRGAAEARRHRPARRGGLGLCARRSGARRRHHPELPGHRHPPRPDGAVEGVDTAKGFIKAKKVAVSAAGHTSVVMESAGVRMPLESYPLQALVSEPVKPVFPCVVMSNAVHAYISQSDKGELVIGSGTDQYVSYSQRGGLPLIEHTLAAICEIFPIFTRMRMLRKWGGIVDVTPDRSAIVGKTPVPNLYVNCGWGTGGFKATPGAAHTFAWTVAKNEPHPINAPFTLERFTTGRLIDEAAAAAVAH